MQILTRSCGCFDVTNFPAVLAPGEACSPTFVFTTRPQRGNFLQTATMRLIYPDGCNRDIVLQQRVSVLREAYFSDPVVMLASQQSELATKSGRSILVVRFYGKNAGPVRVSRPLQYEWLQVRQLGAVKQ